jgi:hypothetical protein
MRPLLLAGIAIFGKKFDGDPAKEQSSHQNSAASRFRQPGRKSGCNVSDLSQFTGGTGQTGDEEDEAIDKAR